MIFSQYLECIAVITIAEQQGLKFNNRMCKDTTRMKMIGNLGRDPWKRHMLVCFDARP